MPGRCPFGTPKAAALQRPPSRGGASRLGAVRRFVESLPAPTWGLALLLATAATQAAPTAGRYDGRLCVAANASAPECGPASVDMRRAGQAIIRISDLLYSLTLHSSQVHVVLKHGAMQIDGFTSPYEWKGTALHFADADKGVRYEVQVGQRQREAR